MPASNKECARGLKTLDGRTRKRHHKRVRVKVERKEGERNKGRDGFNKQTRVSRVKYQNKEVKVPVL